MPPLFPHSTTFTMMTMTIRDPIWPPENNLNSPENHPSKLRYDVVEECFELEPQDFDVPVDAYSCDNFRMFDFKVKNCARARSHDWTDCPFAHPGEKARRRDPRRYHYSGTACPDFRRGACPRGDGCEYAHGVFECWLHPARYRTRPCKEGTHCRRRVCFFAHTPEQLRVLPHTPATGSDASPKSTLYSPPSSPAADSPPVSPLSLSRLAESIRDLQLNKMKLGKGMGTSPPSWGFRFGSPRFMSLPSTPTRRVSHPGMDAWETRCEEEPAMERVESGRVLREKIYAKLSRENSLDRVEAASPVPDFGWVTELVK